MCYTVHKIKHSALGLNSNIALGFTFAIFAVSSLFHIPLMALPYLLCIQWILADASFMLKNPNGIFDYTVLRVFCYQVNDRSQLLTALWGEPELPVLKAS